MYSALPKLRFPCLTVLEWATESITLKKMGVLPSKVPQTQGRTSHATSSLTRECVGYLFMPKLKNKFKTIYYLKKYEQYISVKK